MSKENVQQSWEEYRAQELARLSPLLAALNIEILPQQPHIGGERHLIGPLGSGRKLVLIGRAADGRRVLVKASSDPKGVAEMEHERLCRSVLERIRFAYRAFLSPKEILFTKKGGFAIAVSEFIEQERPFLERPSEEQFALALGAFKAQEGAHAATYAHARAIRSTFGEMRAADYLRHLTRYAQETHALAHDAELDALLARAVEYAGKQQEILEQYCGFLTHWDFVPQNIRVSGGKLFLLDHSSLRFGNKYEGWARFVNFMELYNPPLAEALVQYVADNRTQEESVSLKLMRVYRLAELLRYYAGWLPRAQGDLNRLAQVRIAFWSEVMRCVLDDRKVPSEIIDAYKKTRDALRSEEEKLRQIGLH